MTGSLDTKRQANRYRNWRQDALVCLRSIACGGRSSFR